MGCLCGAIQGCFKRTVIMARRIRSVVSSPVIGRDVVGGSSYGVLLSRQGCLGGFSDVRGLLKLASGRHSRVLSVGVTGRPKQGCGRIFFSLNNARSTICTARISLRRCCAFAARRDRGVRLFTLTRGLNNGLRLTVGQLTRDGHGPRSSAAWGLKA